MRRSALGALLIAATLLFTGYTSAEIYKWVDADGNVHFGDKPKDPAQANKAETVELKESYQPAVRTAQEQEAYDNEQRANQLRTDLNRREAQEAEAEADAERREQKAALCAKYDEALKELETVELKDGVRILTYVEKEDGTSVSSDEQREIIANLKARRAKAGCA